LLIEFDHILLGLGIVTFSLGYRSAYDFGRTRVGLCRALRGKICPLELDRVAAVLGHMGFLLESPAGIA
jgi:hypothetical protein